MFLSLQPKPRNLSPGLLQAKSFLHIRFLCLYIHFVYAALLLGFKEGLLKKLGERIRQIRIDKGITQVQLAHSIGKDQQSIQRLEAGNINPSFFYLNEIARGLDVYLNEITKL